MKDEKEVGSDQWGHVRGCLRQEVGDAAYKSWVKPMVLTGIHDGEVNIGVPTRFMRDFVTTHYADRIRALWSHVDPAIRTVNFVVHAIPSLSAAEPVSRGRSVLRSSGTGGMVDVAPVLSTPLAEPLVSSSPTSSAMSSMTMGFDDREALSASLDPRFTFANFIVGKPNEFAHAAARRVADSDHVPFNPLFLYGGVGLGKTHLMHAIAWHIRERAPTRTVIYLSAEKFMYRFVRALRFQDTMAFKEQFRSVDVLMIDDVQFIAGKDATQEEFFHTFNALVDQGRQIVISADKSPADLEGIEERLRSRLGCGLVADIHATTYELRLGILQHKAERIGIAVPLKVIEFLAGKITSNVRELEGALNRVAAHAQLVGHDITLETTQELLRDLLRSYDRRVTIEEIQRKVAEHFNIKISDMSSARRMRLVARPRQVAMYLSKTLTSRSLPEIGRRFGNRDHTTVMHAVRKVEELIETDLSFAEDVELLRRMLERS